MWHNFAQKQGLNQADQRFTLHLGMVLGKQGRGRPEAQLSDHIKELSSLPLVDTVRLAPGQLEKASDEDNGCSESSSPFSTMMKSKKKLHTVYLMPI